MQGRIKTSLVTEDGIINLSLVFRRLDGGLYQGPGLLKNNMLKCFRWPILYGLETVCSKHSFKNDFRVVI